LDLEADQVLGTVGVGIEYGGLGANPWRIRPRSTVNVDHRRTAKSAQRRQKATAISHSQILIVGAGSQVWNGQFMDGNLHGVRIIACFLIVMALMGCRDSSPEKVSGRDAPDRPPDSIMARDTAKIER
jgi:hypothetical protein